MNISPIIQAEELLTIKENRDLVIVDAGDGNAARENYERKHLEGALFVELNTELSDIKPDLSRGGRHPLPTTENFSMILTDLGISRESHVVIYDDKYAGNAAARFWWMLRAVGHEKVQVINGGIQEAERKGFPVISGREKVKKKGKYPVSEWQLPLSNMEEVEKLSQNKNYIVIDVRDRDRYAGIREPIDLIAGHIPGAINVPYASNLDEKGLYKSPEDLKDKYEKILRDTKMDQIIVHCGSGVTACHTLLAFAYAGLEIPKLYVGSWSEWSRNDKQMITKE